jgi:hypothetical protein
MRSNKRSYKRPCKRPCKRMHRRRSRKFGSCSWKLTKKFPIDIVNQSPNQSPNQGPNQTSDNPCSMKVVDLITTYINLGWSELTGIFGKKTAKEKTIRGIIDEDLLRMLGAIRAYILRSTFDCINNDPNMFLLPIGSTNITSDYDVNVIGINAPKVLFAMFEDFLNKYHKTLPYSFDSNLYCTGIFLMPDLSKNSNNFFPGFKIFKYFEKTIKKQCFTFEPESKEFKKKTLTYACLKLAENGINTYLKDFINNAHELKKDLDQILNEELKKNSEKDLGKNLDIYCRYKLQCSNAEDFYSGIYGGPGKDSGKDSEKIFKGLSYAKCFAIEPYYTQCSINAIVLDLQNPQNLKFTEISYICAAIENIGDFYHHVSSDVSSGSPIKGTLLKYSKNIYRIVYCLEKAGIFKGDLGNLWTKQSDYIKKIVDKRSDISSADSIDFSPMGYDGHSSIQKYVDDTCDKYLLMIQESSFIKSLD